MQIKTTMRSYSVSPDSSGKIKNLITHQPGEDGGNGPLYTASCECKLVRLLRTANCSSLSKFRLEEHLNCVFNSATALPEMYPEDKFVCEVSNAPGCHRTTIYKRRKWKRAYVSITRGRLNVFQHKIH